MASAAEMNEASKEGREFDFEKSLANMVKLSGIDFATTPKTIVENEFRACQNFEDKGILQDWMNSAKNSSVSRKDIEASIERYREIFSTENKGLMIRMIIAAVIERLHSKSDRAEYLFEVINGKAT